MRESIHILHLENTHAHTSGSLDFAIIQTKAHVILML